MKTTTIKIPKILIASAMFLILTAVKLLMPVHTEALCASVRELVGRDYDYEQELEELGGRIAEGKLIQALGLRGPEEETADEHTLPAGLYQPATVDDLRGSLTEVLPEDTVHGEYEEEPAIEPAAEDEIPEAVAAFYETQAEYVDYEVPANVTYDMPEIQFAYTSPVEGYTSSGFGFRRHPIYQEVKFHYGTDYPAMSGDDIYAFADGTVSMVGFEAGYGDYIIIDHADGWATQYAHCGEIYVVCGQEVSMGEKIALVGASGEVTGPHLHFELRCNGIYYNPEYYVA
ncbi:MAG: M23 family metallopeptidase [Clostridia bacterium]|nr:M23 family metallopeptidase [Clostridia bacterium]